MVGEIVSAMDPDRRVACKNHLEEEEYVPIWCLRRVVYGKQPTESFGSSGLQKDWKWCQERGHLVGKTWHCGRYTGLDNLVQSGCERQSRLIAGGWVEGNVMDQTYIQPARDFPIIFQSAHWADNWQRTHVMGRSRLGVDWLQEESWLQVSL